MQSLRVGLNYGNYGGINHARVAAHPAGRDDALFSVAPVQERVPRFADLLQMAAAELMALAGLETTGANGRPLGPPPLSRCSRPSSATA